LKNRKKKPKRERENITIMPDSTPTEIVVVLTPDIERKDMMRSFLGKKEKMHRIFRSMSRIQVQLPSVNVESCSGNDGYAAWYADDPALMDKVRAGM
jgi:hypothetical protein